MNVTFVLLSAFAGAIVGGVINALADDLPHTFRVRGPHYPDGAPRPPLAWLGLLAFLFQRRSSPGGAKLAWRHPIVELTTMLLFAFVAANFPASGRSLFWMGNLAILVLITIIDLEHRLILFVVIIPACLYALVGAALFGPEISDKITFQDYLIGGLSGFALFFIMYLGGMLFTVVMANARKQPIDEVAFGYGDVMLATLSGFMLGWQALIFALTIAVFAGGAGALLFLAFRMVVRGKYEWFTALPYGQYIVFGTVVMMLWRTPVLNWLQNVR